MIILLFIGLVILVTVLGIIVYINSHKQVLNQVFLIFIALVDFWVISNLLSHIPFNKWALLGAQLGIIGPAWIPPVLLIFSYIFCYDLNRFRERRKFIYLTFIPSILISLFTFSRYNVVSLEVTPEGNFFTPGVLYYYFITFFIVSSIIIITYLIKAYKNSTGVKHLQAIYIIFSIVFTIIIGLIFTAILPFFNIKKTTFVGPFSTVFFIGFTSYAIVKHRLMDIKLVVRRYLVYTASLVTVVVPVIIVRYISIIYYYDYATLVEFIVLILAIFVFLPLKNYYYRVANKYLFSSLYDSAEVIASVSDKLRSTLNIKSIYSHIYESLNKAMHLKAFGVLKYSEKTENYYVQYNKGFHLKNRKKFANNRVLHEIFVKRNKALVIDEAIRTHYNSRTKETLDMLTGLEVSILMPLNIKDKVVGLLALGPKESGDMYNKEDMQVLEVISAQAAVAIENATLYDESLKFGIKLKKEVKKATAELRVMNEKLKELDAAKSEFISIASHQLRTPLTVIKGYISMILEGNFGKLGIKEKDPLEKVYESNERLIQLVENLLNISRIESGRLQFTFDNIQLENMAKSVVNELASHAKRKNLKVVYEPPKKPLPLILIDEEKIRQVVMNLIDNAIKYTKDNGKVTVTLREVAGKMQPSAVKARLAEAGVEATTINNFIEFCVEDTGMGIPPNEMKNLFKKFSRAAGTSVVHTEGTGLGLYVARKMIEAHAGRIWAESEGEGQGSRFCFRLPVIEALKK